MKIHPFPNATTRSHIHALVCANAHGRMSRVKTDAGITSILKGYGLSRLHMDGYSIHVADPMETPSGVWPVTRIEAKLTSDGQHCPLCGGKPGFLEGDAFITAACLGCGCVFKFADEGRINL